ncbi:MAG: paraquat-inducible protein A [Cypionkella sp.]|uniref:paraquat-inducible protein A n=1 Tax=Cypionkella sp. TaxID=2811411 RepID=UPI002AB96317|nr:paraquat-inducible protein A [Cypionkella sp.]MDZ4310684.1 paraquat-inducible protein A [Cypionkella sp.]
MAHARGSQTRLITARAAGLIACRTCGRVHQAETELCLRCGQVLSSRDETSLQRVWAWLLAGFMAYIPANLYPMLETTTLGKTQSNTLLGGVVELVLHQSYAVAAIVFVASIVIPIGKFVAISYLAVQVQRPDRHTVHLKHRMLEVVEFIGRWSMIDVFVVALLSSLVQLGTVVSVKPGIAAISFALSVVCTMLSAMSFDSRLIWDTDSKDSV